MKQKTRCRLLHSCNVNVRAQNQNVQFYWVFLLFVFGICNIFSHNKTRISHKILHNCDTLTAFCFYRHLCLWLHCWALVSLGVQSNSTNPNNTIKFKYSWCLFGVWYFFVGENVRTFPWCWNNIWAQYIWHTMGTIGSLRRISLRECGLVVNVFFLHKKATF